MDKKTFTGLFLMLLVIVASFFFMRPSEEEIKIERALQDSIAQAKGMPAGSTAQTITTDTVVSEPTSNPELDSLALASPFGLAKVKNDHITILENEKIKVNISNKGGKVQSVELKGELSYDGKPLILFNEVGNKFGLLFSTAGVNINTDELYFTPQGQSISVTKGDSTSLSFRLSYSQYKYIDYIYTLTGDSYNVGFTILTKGLQDVIAPTQTQLVLNWEASLSQKEKEIKAN